MERLEEVAADCRAKGRAYVLVGNRTHRDKRMGLLKALAAHLEGQSGGLRYMVHCAGIGSPYEHLESLDPDALERAFSVNVTAGLEPIQRGRTSPND